MFLHMSACECEFICYCIEMNLASYVTEVEMTEAAAGGFLLLSLMVC